MVSQAEIPFYQLIHSMHGCFYEWTLLIAMQLFYLSVAPQSFWQPTARL
ncbi:hypothetical protein JCM19236_3514 [Vibrio sp. JCM 19236]|nr:hypothetical protein JCM19236_3514 [Vibrio sp. JCM 19236]